MSVYSGLSLGLIEPDRFPAIDTLRGLPVVVAQGSNAVAVGKGATTAQRKGSAIGEWVERSILYAASPERYASEAELGASCLSPALFGFDASDEMPEHVLPYNPCRTVGWIQVHSTDGEQRWLHQPAWEEPGFYRPTSNGAAVAESRRSALEAAVAELLERHAFVAWWYGLAESSPLTPRSDLWDELTNWLSEHGWELTAHLLPQLTSLPVVLAFVVKRDGAGIPQAGIIGLGTGAVDRAAVSATLEVVQALDAFAVMRAAGRPIIGDLAEFLTPAGSAAIIERLTQGGAPKVGRADGSGAAEVTKCPTAAAREAGIAIWVADRRSAGVDLCGLCCVQVFSPDTLPFPSTGRGRRLNHPVLLEYLRRAGRTTDSIPSLPHPLG